MGMNEHPDKLDKQDEEWKAKACAKGEAKVKMDARLTELDKHKGRVKDQLTKLKSTSHEMWEAKEDVNISVTGLKEAFENAKEHFQ
jgi:hypothetical protein